MMIVTFDWSLISAISQAALGANSYRESNVGRRRSAFDRSFSNLLTNSATASIKNVIIDEIKNIDVTSVMGHGPVNQSQEEHLNKFAFSTPVTVKVFEREYLIYLLLFDGDFGYLNGSKSRHSLADDKNASRIRLMSSLSQTYITIKAVFRHDSFNLSDLASLRIGSVLDLGTMDSKSTLLIIQDTDRAQCSLGKKDGYFTLRLDKML
ncbi:MAG: FliM/FliN family flagellar motor switch protein [Beijerinckiaceae bacterium]|nr:FliM/FliN family flagellar motor switch protein [Beijerinckiaceae bacterium]